MGNPKEHTVLAAPTVDCGYTMCVCVLMVHCDSDPFALFRNVGSNEQTRNREIKMEEEEEELDRYKTIAR